MQFTPHMFRCMRYWMWSIANWMTPHQIRCCQALFATNIAPDYSPIAFSLMARRFLLERLFIIKLPKRVPTTICLKFLEKKYFSLSRIMSNYWNDPLHSELHFEALSRTVEIYCWKIQQRFDHEIDQSILEDFNYAFIYCRTPQFSNLKGRMALTEHWIPLRINYNHNAPPITLNAILLTNPLEIVCANMPSIALVREASITSVREHWNSSWSMERGRSTVRLNSRELEEPAVLVVLLAWTVRRFATVVTSMSSGAKSLASKRTLKWTWKK